MARLLPLNEHELDQLSEEALLQRVVIARRSGLDAEYRTALNLLIFREYDRLVAKARGQLRPDYRHHAADIAEEAFISAMRSSFDSDSIGQFRSWLNTILKARCADFARKRRGASDASLEQEEIELETSDDWHIALVDTSDLVKAALPEKKSHRVAVLLAVFQDKPAAWVAEEINRRYADPGDGLMTENNVAQIVSRFRGKLKALASSAGLNDGTP